MIKLIKNKNGKINFIDMLLVLMLVLVIGVLISSVFSTVEMLKMQDKQENNIMPSRMSRMSLTGFDEQIALEFMDKNHDGRCDVCGMPVEQCIDSGQIECNMDSNAKIGILGSQHVHTDFKVYVNENHLILQTVSII